MRNLGHPSQKDLGSLGLEKFPQSLSLNPNPLLDGRIAKISLKSNFSLSGDISKFPLVVFKGKCKLLAKLDNYLQIIEKSGYDLNSEIDLLWGDFQNFLSDDIMP
jgi:hypothetical protein